MHSVLASLVALTGSSQAGRTVLRESERLDTFATLSAGWWGPQRSCAGMGDGRSGLLSRPMRTLRMRGFNAQAFFGTISLVDARPPASIPLGFASPTRFARDATRGTMTLTVGQ